MNYLMTRIKGRQSADFIIMSLEREFYQRPNVVKCLEYNDEYKIQDDEWFVVNDFHTKTYCWNLLKNHFDPTAYSNLPRNSYPKMNYIYAEQDGIFYFQKITNSRIFRKQLISLCLDQEPTMMDRGYVVEINDMPEAFFDSSAKKLYFRRLSDITNIFVGIDELYREATDEEVDSLLAWRELQVDAEFDKTKVKTANRRKIKEAIQNYNAFSDEDKIIFHSYINIYCSSLIDATTNKYKISSEAELTAFLNGVNQRYYTTEINKIKRLANSITNL